MHESIINYEKKQIKKNIHHVHPGDTVSVKSWFIEGNKKRFQLFEGIVISVKNRGFNSSFTVRKLTSGEGVERIFPVYSSVIEEVKIKKSGVVRKSKLYYFRNLKGKSARIKTKLK